MHWNEKFQLRILVPKRQTVPKRQIVPIVKGHVWVLVILFRYLKIYLKQILHSGKV